MVWVFDCDGTLYPDCAEIHNVFVAHLRMYFSKLLQMAEGDVEQERVRLRVKYSTEFSLIAFHKEYGCDFTASVAATYGQIDLRQCGVQPLAEIVRRMLVALPGTKVVFSNSPKAWVHQVITYLGVPDVFAALFGIEEIGFLGKPDASAYASVERAYPTGHLVLCDDSATNLDIAHERGWGTVYFNPNGAEGNVKYKHRQIRSLLELAALP
jgi:putative hydrolase of the HAD superfamily